MGDVVSVTIFIHRRRSDLVEISGPTTARLYCLDR